jgi:hypothetical protein
MDREIARELANENLKKSPSEFDRQFEALFANPHFGDVVTEVFPSVLDPHDRRGRQILKKYAELGAFLEETKDKDDAWFVGARTQTSNLQYTHTAEPALQKVDAIAVYTYIGVRAEHFQAVRDEQGKAMA